MGRYLYPNECPYCGANLTIDDSVHVVQSSSALTSVAENGGGKGVLHSPPFEAFCNDCGETLKREWSW